MATDLNIRIINNLKNTSFFTLYQQNINLNTRNFKIGAWEKGYIAFCAEFFTVLSLNFEIQAKINVPMGCYKTKLINASYNSSYEIYTNNNGIDIHESNLIKPSSPITKINYDGQSYINILLNENVSTIKFQIYYNFNLPPKRIF